MGYKMTNNDNTLFIDQLAKLIKKDESPKIDKLITKSAGIIDKRAGSVLELLNETKSYFDESKSFNQKIIVNTLKDIENYSKNVSLLNDKTLEYVQQKVRSIDVLIDKEIGQEEKNKKSSNVVDSDLFSFGIKSPSDIKRLNADSDEKINLYEQAKGFLSILDENITKEVNTRFGLEFLNNDQTPNSTTTLTGKVTDLAQLQKQTSTLLEQESIYKQLLDYQNSSIELGKERLLCLDEEKQQIITNTNIQIEFQKQQSLENERKKQLSEGQKFAEEYGLSDTEKVNQNEEDNLSKLAKWYQLSQEMNAGNYEILLQQDQLYQDAKSAIEQDASTKRKDIIDNEQQKRLQDNIELLNSSSQLFSSMGDLIGAFGGESSDAYKAMFAISKGFAIASTTLSMFTNIGKAAEVGFPANIPIIAQATAQGVSIISSIKGTNLSGQAHSGIDYIPREGTWLLDKGERVVDARTNTDLKNFLQSSNEGLSGFSVNVPVTISGGDVSEAEGKQLGMMIKQSVMSIIQEQQRPGGVLNRY